MQRRRLTYRGGTVELADGPHTPAQQVQGGARTLTRSQRLNGNPRAGGKTANSLPEVKREKGPPELPPLTGFLPFFVTCHAVTQYVYF